MNIHTFMLTIVLTICPLSKANSQKQKDYTTYHRDIIRAEEWVAKEEYANALSIFEKVFASYDFIFLKDYKIAAQLSLFLKDDAKAFKYVRSGIADGWTLKEIEKDKFFNALQKMQEWKIIRSQYDSLRKRYTERTDQKISAEIQEMFKKDQRLDLPYYFRIGQKAKDRYAVKKFAPNSEKQMIRLKEILREYGYPGERLIGNDFWMSTILVHHNSISSSYARSDTLYPSLQPLLMIAIQKGQMAPEDHSLIEDWYISVRSDHKQGAFGYVSSLNEQEFLRSDELRKSIGLCPIQTRNQLIDIQERTGMNFYVDGAGWVKKITSVNK